MAHGSGVYTTALLTPGRELLDWARHRQRLLEGVALLEGGREARPFRSLLEALEARGSSLASFLDGHVAAAVRATLAEYYGAADEEGVDGRQQAAAQHALLVLCIAPAQAREAEAEAASGVSPPAGGGAGGLPATVVVLCKEAAVPPYGAEHAVQAAVMGRPRTLAGAKASSWVAERRQYEAAKPAEASEVLLLDADGRILEGLTTNFFVITVNDDNDPSGGGAAAATLHACDPASGAALPGVVQGRVLEAAQRLGMRVVLAAPRAAERHTWSEAFISNCIRRVQPLSRVFCPAGNAWGVEPWEVQLPHPAGPHTTALRDEVARLEERTHWQQL